MSNGAYYILMAWMALAACVYAFCGDAVRPASQHPSARDQAALTSFIQHNLGE